LRNRNYRLFFIGQTISNVGNWLTMVAVTLMVLELTGSGVGVGLLAACEFGPMLFLSGFAGAVADRSDKRHLLLWSQSLEMSQSIGLAVLAFLPHPPLAGFYVLAVWGGILLAFDSPLRRSFVSEMVPPGEIPNAVVLYSTMANLSRDIGPALAGLLIVTVGYGWTFTIDAASYLAVLAGIVMMRPAELHRPPPRPRAKGEVREGLRYVASIPQLWLGFAMFAVIGTLSYNFTVTLPLFVTKGLHAAATDYTLLYAVFSIGAVLSGLVIARRGLVHVRHILLGAAALGVTMFLLAAMPNTPTALPAAFLVGMASILYMTSTTANVQVQAKQEMHGRILALQTVVLGGTSFFGGLLLGWIADILGGRALMVLGGVAAISTAAMGRSLARHYGADARIEEPAPTPVTDSGPLHLEASA
jgi:MFS family permease